MPDALGRVVMSKDIRPLPEVTGNFRHTVSAIDRLDQLAHKYYREPVEYWHICDANPDHLSPLALLDHEPVTTTQFPIALKHPPSWAALLRALAGVVGVERVVVVEDVELRPMRLLVDGRPIPLAEEHASRAVQITYNRISVTAEALADQIRALDFQMEGFPSHIGQLGQQIVIPPKVIG